MNLTEEHIQLNGLSVNYVHGGSGFPILFLHNGNGFWQSWKHQLDYFSQHYTVYALDWPGCGESEPPVTPLFLDVMHAVLEEFVRVLGLTKFHLVGNCIGASEALKYSIAHSSHVDKLVLMNICPGDLLLPRWVNKEKAASYRNQPSAMRKRAKLLGALFPSIITKRVFPRILFGNSIRSSDTLFRMYRRRQKEPGQKSICISRLILTT
jgi:pimeloyl-ACP methyl ester carboxylesterase